MNRIMLATVMLVAACSSDASQTAVPTQTRANAVDAATASADETERAVDAIAGTSSALTPAGLRAGLMSLAIPQRTLCATASSDTDSDGDGTPDDATFTYALPACAYANFRGGDLALTGAIHVTDTDPLAGYAYRLEYQDFTWRMSLPDTTQSFAATRNGIRRLALDGGTLVLTSTVTMQRAFGVRGRADVGGEIRSVFTPAGSLTFGLPMPDGAIAQSGTVTFNRQGILERYDVRTVTPLRIDATCAAYPRISAGEVRYVATDSSFVKVTWPGCGQPAQVEAVAP